MARPLRIEYPGAWYHVTCRGNERRAVFNDDVDRLRFLDILETTSNLFDVEVHAYVLMDNHFHLVLMTREGNLNKFMQRLNTSYTVHFNRRHERNGHLFQGRYKGLLIDAESYLLELSRYVHLNPVRIRKHSGLEVAKKRKITRDYPWSSFRGYTRLGDRLPFVNCSKILGMVGGGNDQEARKRYAGFVLSGILKDMNIDFWEGVRGQAILGSDGFVDWVKERFLSKQKGDRRELPGLKALQTGGGPGAMEEIAEEVASRFLVEENELYFRYGSCREARSVFMELCCLFLSKRMSLSEIGRRLGNVSVAALSQNRKRLAARMRKVAKLRKGFEELKTVLSKYPDQSTVKV